MVYSFHPAVLSPPRGPHFPPIPYLLTWVLIIGLELVHTHLILIILIMIINHN